MELHHKKHHQAYVTNLNAALEQYAAAEHKGDLKAMISLQGAIKFNGGGHINHAMFWQMLTPPKASPARGRAAGAARRRRRRSCCGVAPE